MNGAPSSFMPQPMVGTPTTQQGIDPGRRLVWETFNAVLREELEHQRPVALRPIEVMEALYAPPAAQVGMRQTLLRFQGPPMEQPGVRPGSTVDPAGFVLDVSRPSGDEGDPPQKLVEYADGTSSLWRDDGVAIGEKRWRGPVLYEYLGQVRRGESKARRGGPQWVDGFRGYEDYSPRGQIIGAQWFDSKGGKWVAVDLDEGALARRVAEYDRAMRLATGIAEPKAERANEWRDEQGGHVVQQSWTRTDCDGVPYRSHDGDGREQQTSLTERQKASALVMVRDGAGVFMCGGVFVDDETVLTSAHCVWEDRTSAPVAISRLMICTRGNYYSGARCTTATDLHLAPDWTGTGWQPEHDYALIDLSTNRAFVASHTEMWLSGASDSYVTSYRMHSIGHPLHAPPTGTCSSATVDTGTSASHRSGHFLVHGMGDIAAPTGFSSFHFNLDGGPGHSGSPIYYCGESRCDTGDGGVVVSVWKGWNGFYTTHLGPKVRNFRDWALAEL